MSTDKGSRSIAVVTAIFGDKDELHEPRGKGSPDIQYVCISDRARQSRRWEIKLKTDKHLSTNRLEARRCKLLVGEWTDADVVIWADGSFKLNAAALNELAGSVSAESPLALFQHPERNCIYDEFLFIRRFARAKFSHAMKSQIECYSKIGFRKNQGLYATGLMVRLMTPQIRSLNRLWWEQVKLWSERDQISLPFLLEKTEIPVTILPGNVLNNSYAEYIGHRF